MSNSSCVTIYDLRTGEKASHFECESPRRAVLEIFALDNGDLDFENYERRYGHRVVEGDSTVAIGDFCAMAA